MSTQMQIPQTVINMLSAKGKGYVEAAMKIAEGQRLVNEGTLEIAHLDGRKLSTKERMHAGGVDITAGVRDLAKPKITVDYLKTLLKDGPLSSRELGERAGCSGNRARALMVECDGVYAVGTGNQVKWALGTAPKTASKLTKKRAVANKTTRRAARTAQRSVKTRRQASAAAADPAQQKADEDKIIACLKEKPGLTIGGLMKKLKRSFYPVERAINSLVADGRLKESVVTMEKTNRKLTTWVPTTHGA